LHYKKFEPIDGVKYRETADLQEIAKTLFNRQRTQEHGVNKNNVLKHLILAQLNDELPALDPQLLTYINDKRIPGADLFLRMIGCPNVLALLFCVYENWRCSTGIF